MNSHYSLPHSPLHLALPPLPLAPKPRGLQLLERGTPHKGTPGPPTAQPAPGEQEWDWGFGRNWCHWLSPCQWAGMAWEPP